MRKSKEKVDRARGEREKDRRGRERVLQQQRVERRKDTRIRRLMKKTVEDKQGKLRWKNDKIGMCVRAE
jgi:hypothetical protein